jgi:hypothetical protein
MSDWQRPFIEERLAEAKRMFETWPKEKQDAMRRFVSGEPPVMTRPAGCICPPGSNKDCEAPLCPRRNPFSEAPKG